MRYINDIQYLHDWTLNKLNICTSPAIDLPKMTPAQRSVFVNQRLYHTHDLNRGPHKEHSHETSNKSVHCFKEEVKHVVLHIAMHCLYACYVTSKLTSIIQWKTNLIWTNLRNLTLMDIWTNVHQSICSGLREVKMCLMKTIRLNCLCRSPWNNLNKLETRPPGDSPNQIWMISGEWFYRTSFTDIAQNYP